MDRAFAIVCRLWFNDWKMRGGGSRGLAQHLIFSALFYVRTTCPTVGNYVDLVQTPSAELATARCRATDSTLHQRRPQPWPVAARAGGVARWTRSRSRYGGTAGTRCCSGHRLLQRGLLVVEGLRGSTAGSARLCVGAPRQAHRRHQGRGGQRE